MRRFFIFHFSFFILSALFVQTGYAACSKSALTQCLDSVCATNIGMNPAARCQLCGTASAGGGDAAGLKNISMGANSKNILSAAEQKNAPSDPGQKYIWATDQCVKKIAGCTADDVSATYDTLIEQSCRAAGISTEMAGLAIAAKKTKTQNVCDSEIRSCISDAKRCGANWMACESDTNFDKYYSECAVESTDCDAFGTIIRTALIGDRNTAVKNNDTLLAKIVNTYQTARSTESQKAADSCKDNKSTKDCVETVCQNNMRNKCAAGNPAEVSMATLLCKYNGIACERLR